MPECGFYWLFHLDYWLTHIFRIAFAAVSRYNSVCIVGCILGIFIFTVVNLLVFTKRKTFCQYLCASTASSILFVLSCPIQFSHTHSSQHTFSPLFSCVLPFRPLTLCRAHHLQLYTPNSADVLSH